MLILGLIGLKVTVHVQSQSHHPTDVCQKLVHVSANSFKSV